MERSSTKHPPPFPPSVGAEKVRNLLSLPLRISSGSQQRAVACRYDVPLVADIHFQPTVAMIVAEAFEKIRINPGNFADGRKTFDVINYDDPQQFDLEREHIREVYPLPTKTFHQV